AYDVFEQCDSATTHCDDICLTKQFKTIRFVLPQKPCPPDRNVLAASGFPFFITQQYTVVMTDSFVSTRAMRINFLFMVAQHEVLNNLAPVTPQDLGRSYELLAF
ncbi:MAG: hypothetical protein QMC37_02625, partial [Flavobacteriales bacterium]